MFNAARLLTLVNSWLAFEVRLDRLGRLMDRSPTKVFNHL